MIESGGVMDRIEIIEDDITKLSVDAIVNAANSSLLGGGGVDGAIHRAAGKELLKECRLLNGCKTGEAKITKGYNLSCKYIIHTVGPVYQDGKKGEKEHLFNCYMNSLILAAKNGVRTIAFPCISTGIYGYPFDEACLTALSAINSFLDKDETIEKVVLVCYGQEDYDDYVKLLEQDT